MRIHHKLLSTVYLNSGLIKLVNCKWFIYRRGSIENDIWKQHLSGLFHYVNLNRTMQSVSEFENPPSLRILHTAMPY